MITGNKGEWSEIYTLFKLLGDKELHPGNSEINKLESIVYPILRILRTEVNGKFEYSIEDDIVVISGNEEVFRIPISTFQERAKYLLTEIKRNSGTFSIPEIEGFMQSINCISLKAKSSAKTDITIVVHDQRTGLQPSLGFSIKSQLGNPSTLLNAGETTNFIFKIDNLILTQDQISEINTIDTKSKIKERIEKIKYFGGNLEFQKVESSIFGNNLILIDSGLPKIIAESLKLFFTSTLSTIVELTNQISISNPLNYNLETNHPFYSYKVKRFLTEVALGMMPSKVWTGKLDTTGGYLVVKENGEVLCYHIYNRNEFEDYLFTNTKLETASSKRHEFGKIYEENGQYYFKLNLQIRFK